MAFDSRSKAAIRRPLEDALVAELEGLDLRLLRIWAGLFLAGVPGGVLMAVFVSPELGVACGVTALAYGLFFVAAAFAAARGRSFPLVVAIVEGAIPWTFSLLLVFTKGPIYAMGSWVPPMLFAALIVSQTARFRIVAPIAVGVSGAAAHLLVYVLFVRSSLPPNAPLFAQLAMQVTRGLSLIAAGVLGAMIGMATRRVVGRAERVVREQDLFGKYRMLRHLASGGMGTVFEALYCPEGGFERRVAVKRIHPHLAEMPSFVDAFRAEAELSARLAHPNIVQVLDFGRVDDTYFLAMELVEGVSLAAIARQCFRQKEGLSPTIVAYVGRSILAGLAHAHGGARDGEGRPLRIVHRDLCPANVLVTQHGDLKISDFGVARALGDAAAGHTRSLEGHAPYMAPEQVRCEAFDQRVDLFALGVILWELLVGRRLFQQTNEHQTLLAVLNAAVPPPSLSRSRIDPAWDAFFEQALARAPDARFATAEAMSAALDGLPGAQGGRPDQALASRVAGAAAVAAEPKDPATVRETR